MKRLIKRDKKRRFFGRDTYELYNIICILCDLEDGIDMTDQEETALDVAIQALSHIRYAMETDGKVRWES